MFRFKMCGIHVKQFAMLPANEIKEDVGVDFDVNFQHSMEDHMVRCDMKQIFHYGKEILVLLEVACDFKIHDEDWNEQVCTKEKTVIPKYFLECFVTHTLGTSRGILFCKTEGTPYNKLIVPPLDVNNLVKKDMIIEDEK